MNLSHERFLKVIATLNSQDGIEHEQRSQPRVGMRATALIAPQVDDEFGPAYGVRLADVSAGGAAIQHFQALPKGKQFVIDLPERSLGSEMSSIRVLCRVLHCHMVAEHQFVIGAQFIRIWTAPAPTLDTARAMAN